MDLSKLKPAEGSIKKKGKRLGRGQGSGKGGTATRGHKGQKSRSGYSKKIGFEGGQMPIQRRVPKFGFKNPNRVQYKPVNLDLIQNLVDNKKVKSIDAATLYENGIISKNELFKVLGRGELKSKIDVTAHGFSSSAKAVIEKAGGKTTQVDKYGNTVTPEAKEEKAEKTKKSAPKAKAEAKTKTEEPKEESKPKEEKKAELKEEPKAEKKEKEGKGKEADKKKKDDKAE